jgi:hypothetical protein
MEDSLKKAKAWYVKYCPLPNLIRLISGEK